MKPIKRILFATDFSDASRNALAHAVRLSRDAGAELHLLHVVVTVRPSIVPRDLDNREYINPPPADLAQKRLDEVAIEAGVNVIRVIEHADTAAPTVLAYAEKHDIDLIVVGRSGQTGLARLYLGSETQKLVRQATGPVLVVGPSPEHAPREEGFKRILAPVDLSASSRAAAIEASALARHHAAKLLVLHVLEQTPLPRYYPAAIDRIRRGHAVEALDNFLGELRLNPTPEALVEMGPATLIISEVAANQGADLIVMSTGGLGTWARFMVGSVTERILRDAPCPVWVERAVAEPSSD
jgi:nucleotide-binding universal stress UspA family protein